MQPIPLTPIRIDRNHARYLQLLNWPFGASAFYESQVTRLLHHDIPQRMAYGACECWIYSDPDGHDIGFSTLQVSSEYSQFTNGRPHAYIPLLAVNPGFMRRGHGHSIVQHLIEESRAILARTRIMAEFVFLDVYSANQKAIGVYQKAGFEILNPDAPIDDPDENRERYFVMAKHLKPIV